MSKLILFLIAITLGGSGYAQSLPTKEQQEVQKVLVDLFETFSKYDPAVLKRSLTPDVLILENGVVWNIDTLVVKLEAKRPEDFKRINSLRFIQTEIKGGMSFVTYYNHADIHRNGMDRVVDWIESAVLVKNEKKWKVKMLHSTRLADKK